MAKKGKQKATNDNQAPQTTNDTGEAIEAPKGKKQKKTYN